MKDIFFPREIFMMTTHELIFFCFNFIILVHFIQFYYICKCSLQSSIMIIAGCRVRGL